MAFLVFHICIQTVGEFRSALVDTCENDLTTTGLKMSAALSLNSLLVVLQNCFTPRNQLHNAFRVILSIFMQKLMQYYYSQVSKHKKGLAPQVSINFLPRKHAENGFVCFPLSLLLQLGC